MDRITRTAGLSEEIFSSYHRTVTETSSDHQLVNAGKWTSAATDNNTSEGYKNNVPIRMYRFRICLPASSAFALLDGKYVCQWSTLI